MTGKKKATLEPEGLEVKHLSSETVYTKCGAEKLDKKASVSHLLQHILQGADCVLNPPESRNRVVLVLLVAELEAPVDEGERTEVNGHFELLSTSPGHEEALELLTLYTVATVEAMELEKNNKQ